MKGVFLIFIGVVQLIIGMLVIFSSLNYDGYGLIALGVVIAFPAIVPSVFGVMSVIGSIEANDQEVIIRGNFFVRSSCNASMFNMPLTLKYNEIFKVEYDHNPIVIIVKNDIKLIVNCISNAGELYIYISEKLSKRSEEQQVNKDAIINENPVNTQYQANPFIYTNQTSVKEETILNKKLNI